MMEGGAAIPVESVAVCPASGRQRRVSPTPSVMVPGGQGKAVPALPPALPVAAGPVVPVPGTVVPVPSVPGLAVPVAVVPVPVVPVLDAPPAPAPELPPAPLACAKARPDSVSRKAVAKGRVFDGLMDGSHSCGMEVNRLVN